MVTIELAIFVNIIIVMCTYFSSAAAAAAAAAIAPNYLSIMI
jgi:hypothetical protein